MCGIAGILLKQGHEVCEDVLRRMGRRQEHRGPDEFGVFRDGNFGVAHNRLSILDLTGGGTQPVVSKDHVLAYNGEIYNYKCLAAKLHEQGVICHSGSDTAVLFAYLVHFGVEATLKDLRGMFAFAFFDRRGRKVYLGRDRLGIKPLYYTIADGAAFWASEVKALMEAVSVEPDPVQALVAMASVGEKLNERTVFRSVRKVPPGCYVEIGPGDTDEKCSRYCDINDWVDEGLYRELNRAPRAEVVERMEMLLKRSVDSMLMGDVPIGAFVSGGIDSSLIASCAVRNASSFALFTSHVVGKFSEIEDARRLSSTLKKELIESRFPPEMFLAELPRATYHYEAPIVIHTNAVPFAVLAQATRAAGVKAVLTGEGSDELFLGYPRLLTRKFDRLVRAPIDFLRRVYGLWPSLEKYVFHDGSGTILSFIDRFVQGFERQRFRSAGLERWGFLPSEAANDQYRSIQMIREGLVALLHRNDTMGMAASIESRFPFLDEELIRFAINLPLKWKIGRSTRFHNWKHPFLTDKAVVRWAAEKHLPACLSRKQKNGFPMYGYKFLEVDAEVFKDGYIQGAFGLTHAALKYMVQNENRYFIGKALAVEIFGQIYGRRTPVHQITESLMKHARVSIG